MQLTIDSKDIVDIKMSTVEESADKQVSVIINDIKKDIQSNIEDDLKDKDKERLANAGVSEKKPDIIDVKPEKQLNGRDEEVIIPNGTHETPNNDKENDAPKDSEIVVKVVNETENSSVEINKNQLISDNMDSENETAATTLIEANKDDEDDLKDKDEERLANAGVSEKEPDIIDVKPEKQLNGRDEEVIIPNGTHETPNNDKENDVPKDSEIVVKVVNETENSSVEINKNQLISDNMDNENETAATTLIEANKDDVVNSRLNNKLTENVSESERPIVMPLDDERSETSDIVNFDNAKTLNKKVLENNEQIDDDPVSDSSNSMDISAAENSEHIPPTSSENKTNSIVAEEIESFDSKKGTEKKDSLEIGLDVNKVIENISKDEVDKSAVIESHGPLQLPAETIVLENETTNNIPKEFYQSEIIADLDVNSLNESNSLNDSDKQTQCEKDIEGITEDKTILTEDNSTKIESNENISSDKVIDSSTSDAIPTAIQTSSEQKTENKMDLDVSENEPTSDPIVESDSNMSEKKSNEISVEQTNGDSSDKKTIVKTSVVEKLKEPDCVSVSSMEVDDVEIVPTEKIDTEISNSQDDATDISITKEIDNIIEILDQDVVESVGNVEPEKKCEINLDSKKIDQLSIDTKANVDDKVDISDEDDIKIVEETNKKPQIPKKDEPSVESKPLPVVCKLSNTLDILSDEEDEPPSEANKSEEKKTEPQNKYTFDILSDEEDQPPSKVSKTDDKNSKLENKHTLDILSDEEDQPPPKVSKTEDKKQVRERKHTLDILSDEEDQLPSKVSKTEDKKQVMESKHTLDILSDEEDQPPPTVSKAADKKQVTESQHTLDILSDEEDQPPPKVSKTEDKKQVTESQHTLDILSDEEDQPPPKVSKTEDKKQVMESKHTLDILSDEEDQPPPKVSKVEDKKQEPENKQCIDIDDDDDIMVIDDAKETTTEVTEAEKENSQKTSNKVVDETGEKKTSKPVEDPTPNINEKESITADVESPKVSEKEASPAKEIKESKPLLPIDFLKSAKKNLAEMTRDELEEFCILKIVESIVDRSSLSDIKSKLKTIEKNMDEYRKKAMLLSKQNRDLQVVLKSVQEEQKTKPNSSITPLKITRSVGMQVLMMDRPPKKKPPPQNSTITPIKPVNRNMVQPGRPQRTMSVNQNIPVPRLIPASPAKSTPSSPITGAKPQTPNGIRNSVSPAQKGPEKRPLTRQAASSSNTTVDLTDDEPPAKINKSSPVPPVRLVPSQNLMAPIRPQIATTGNPRKVFIPINGQGHNLVRGQTVMLKSTPMGPRQRLPSIPRMSSQVRMNLNRHPAPLPDVTKQYQPPTWKALPPAPDLKLSKVENGIVISWKIEGYQEDSYEKIASYQLYAYQETSTPPSTALWKKIGDVKALPLPMACTLTQFMAGFKYYFAVRAVDVKSRLGPFSLPGSILLLNKI